MTIYKALLKYGYSNFQLEILEYCEPKNTMIREQHYMDICKPEYNILKTAGSTLGYKHKEEAKAKMAAANLGRKRSEETKIKMADIQKVCQLPISQPTAQKIEVLDLKTNNLTVYNSTREAERALN
jgi:group I intron endonuclease